MRFKNPQNGFVEETNHPALWTLIFGGFYFAKHGEWSHFVISFLAACLTGGISWLIYPFFAENAIRKSYLRKGWTEMPRYEGTEYATVKRPGATWWNP